MDKVLDPKVKLARRKAQLSKLLLLLILLLGGLWLLNQLLQPSLSVKHIRVGVVERGMINASITASGVVVPKIEQLVTSELDSTIAALVSPVGSQVKAGDP